MAEENFALLSERLFVGNLALLKCVIESSDPDIGPSTLRITISEATEEDLSRAAAVAPDAVRAVQQRVAAAQYIYGKLCAPRVEPPTIVINTPEAAKVTFGNPSEE